MGIFSGKSDYRFIIVHMAYILVNDCMLQIVYKIGGNVKNCVMLSKTALMTKLVTYGTRTQFWCNSPN